MQITELKKKIRSLKKLKRDLRKGTEERKRINHKLRESKTDLNDLINPDSEKLSIIAEITKIKESKGTTVIIDLRNYTKKQLLFHLERIKNGGSSETKV